jgi:hypothetical protein
MATPVLAASDIQPREVAEGLAALVAHIGDQDAELVGILRDAQRRLETLAWNRYAARHNRRDARRTFVRHHKALMPIRAR